MLYFVLYRVVINPLCTCYRYSAFLSKIFGSFSGLTFTETKLLPFLNKRTKVQSVISTWTYCFECSFVNIKVIFGRCPFREGT